MKTKQATGSRECREGWHFQRQGLEGVKES